MRRKAFIRRWRLKHRAVADRLFSFTRLQPSQWRSDLVRKSLGQHEIATPSPAISRWCILRDTRRDRQAGTAHDSFEL
jgi:hypothetical protein